MNSEAVFAEARKAIAEARKSKATVLELRNTRLEELPGEICELKQVRQLFLGGLASFGTWVLYASHLWPNPDTTPLDISAIAELPNLERLDLTHRPVVSLQPLLRQTKLRCLSLSGANLIDLEIIGQLKSLERLSLANNPKLKSVAALASLKRLRNLNLSGCTGISDVRPLMHLPLLRLDLSFNARLRTTTHLGSLAGLRELSLAGCKRIEVIEALSDLPLTALDLEGCKAIRDIRPISKIPTLTRLTLDDEVWLEPEVLDGLPKLTHLRAKNVRGAPPELTASTTNCQQAVRAWWKDLRHEEESVQAVKVYLLGNGGVGKTQIKRRLLGRPYDSTIPSTHAIEPEDCLLPSGLTLQLWDFGGQDIYHGTHALFFDKRAIYVIAWSLPTDENETADHPNARARPRTVDYWLDYIREYGCDSTPVILAQTKCDSQSKRRKPSFSATDRFRWLESVSCSAKVPEGMSALEAQLSSAARYLIEQCGQWRVPSAWMRIRTAVRKRAEQERVMSTTDFRILCAETAGAACTDPLIVLSWLHQTGVCFYLPARFQEKIILDLPWALEGLYAALDRSGVAAQIQKSTGRFNVQWLSELAWEKRTDWERAFFVDLMQRSQLCFPIGMGQYILPTLLPAEEDVYAEIDKTWQNARVECLRKISYPFLHEGILQACVCTLGTICGTGAVYWAYGACHYNSRTSEKLRVRTQVQVRKGGRVGGSILIETSGGNATEAANRVVAALTRGGGQKQYRVSDGTKRIPKGFLHAVRKGRPTNYAATRSTLLFLGTDRFRNLKVDVEFREIEDAINAVDRNAFWLRPGLATRLRDIVPKLSQYSPNVVHFSGHGSDTRELVFEGDNREALPVSREAFREAIGLQKKNIKLVVLNACNSQEQAKELAKVVDCAIGMPKEITDKHAIEFAAAFYSALADRTSVRDAFDRALAVLKLWGLTRDFPILEVRQGVRASELFLVGESPTNDEAQRK